MKIENRGVIPALITPLREDETVDVPSLERMLEWVLRSDIKGVFVGGTIGEGAALRDRERQRLIEEAIRIVRGRVPVLVNVSDTGTVRSLENIDQAAKAGADAVIATPRLVFPARTPDATWQFFKAMAEHSPVPVWFYENPGTTPVTSTFEDISRILEIPNVGGLKYSAAHPELYAKCAAAFGARLPVYNGNAARHCLRRRPEQRRAGGNRGAAARPVRPDRWDRRPARSSWGDDGSIADQWVPSGDIGIAGDNIDIACSVDRERAGCGGRGGAR